MAELTTKEREQIALSESIVSSEPFLWLMSGSNHTEAQLQALRKAYREWQERSGGFKNYNGLGKKVRDGESDGS